MGNSAASKFPYVVREDDGTGAVPPAVTHSQGGANGGVKWKIEPGIAKSSKAPVSIFNYSKPKAEEDDTLKAVRNGIKKLKLLRHPHVLRYMDALEVPASVFVVTEPVLSLQSLLPTLTSGDIPRGLYQVMQGLQFLHDDCQLSHNNFTIASIFVSVKKNGEWILGGLEWAVKTSTLSKGFLDSTKGLRDVHTVPPEEGDTDYRASDYGVHCRDAWALHHVVTSLIDAIVGDTALPENLETFLTDCEALADVSPDCRPSMETMLTWPFFRADPLVVTMVFLSQYRGMEPGAARESMFSNLPSVLESLPAQTLHLRIVPLLLNEAVVSEPDAAGLLACLFTPGTPPTGLVDGPMYLQRVVPFVMDGLKARSRPLRAALLRALPYYGRHVMGQAPSKSFLANEVLIGLKDNDVSMVTASCEGLIHLAELLLANMDAEDVAVVNSKLVPELARLTRDPSDHVRCVAARALAQMAIFTNQFPQLLLQPILTAQQTAIGDPIAVVRVAGLEALQESRDAYTPPIITILMTSILALLLDTDARVRIQADEAMHEFLAVLRSADLKPTDTRECIKWTSFNGPRKSTLVGVPPRRPLSFAPRSRPSPSSSATVTPSTQARSAPAPSRQPTTAPHSHPTKPAATREESGSLLEECLPVRREDSHAPVPPPPHTDLAVDSSFRTDEAWDSFDNDAAPPATNTTDTNDDSRADVEPREDDFSTNTAAPSRVVVEIHASRDPEEQARKREERRKAFEARREKRAADKAAQEARDAEAARELQERSRVLLGATPVLSLPKRNDSALSLSQQDTTPRDLPSRDSGSSREESRTGTPRVTRDTTANNSTPNSRHNTPTNLPPISTPTAPLGSSPTRLSTLDEVLAGATQAIQAVKAATAKPPPSPEPGDAEIDDGDEDYEPVDSKPSTSRWGNASGSAAGKAKAAPSLPAGKPSAKAMAIMPKRGPEPKVRDDPLPSVHEIPRISTSTSTAAPAPIIEPMWSAPAAPEPAAAEIAIPEGADARTLERLAAEASRARLGTVAAAKPASSSGDDFFSDMTPTYNAPVLVANSAPAAAPAVSSIRLPAKPAPAGLSVPVERKAPVNPSMRAAAVEHHEADSPSSPAMKGWGDDEDLDIDIDIDVNDEPATHAAPPREEEAPRPAGKRLVFEDSDTGTRASAAPPATTPAVSTASPPETRASRASVNGSGWEDEWDKELESRASAKEKLKSPVREEPASGAKNIVNGGSHATQSAPVDDEPAGEEAPVDVAPAFLEFLRRPPAAAPAPAPAAEPTPEPEPSKMETPISPEPARSNGVSKGGSETSTDAAAAGSSANTTPVTVRAGKSSSSGGGGGSGGGAKKSATAKRKALLTATKVSPGTSINFDSDPETKQPAAPAGKAPLRTDDDARLAALQARLDARRARG